MQGVISGKEIKLLKQNSASSDAENTPYESHGGFAWVGNAGLRLLLNTDCLCNIAGKVCNSNQSSMGRIKEGKEKCYFCSCIPSSNIVVRKWEMTAEGHPHKTDR